MMKAARKSLKRRRRKFKQAKRVRTPRRTLRKAFCTFLRQGIFTNLGSHGNTEWSMSVLACVGLLWGLSGETTLGDRFVMATEVAGQWFSGEFIAGTYRGFMKALVTHNTRLVDVIAASLRMHMLRENRGFETIAGLIPFVVDGSKIAAPWTKANEHKLGKKGRKPQGEKCRRKETDLRPQLTLTLLWHLGWGLPWAWKQGGLVDGERTQFRELLKQLPLAALVIADAGFVGYQLWRDIIESGRHFLVRVGGNVELLKELCPGAEIHVDGETVWLWPEGMRQKGHPPLKLRLIIVQQGQQTWYLVTSLLDPAQLTSVQAQRLYQRRWGIECCFRTLKQTFERGKARSYTPECAGCELDWSLLSLWLLSLMTKQELLDAKIDPQQYSPATARRLVRRELRYQAVGHERMDLSALQTAIQDPYKSSKNKKARHDQRKKRDPAPGAPKITTATQEQTQAAQQFRKLQKHAA